MATSACLSDCYSIDGFEDGVDVIALVGGLSFDELTISQGMGAHADDSVVSLTESMETLAVVSNISADNLSGADFILL